MNDQVRQLDRDGCRALASALGDTPYTVLPVDALLRGLCSAWTLGSPERFATAVVRRDALPDEPEGFGRPEGIWLLLRELPGWKCVSVDAGAAEPLAEIMRREVGGPVSLYDDLHHVLDGPTGVFRHPDVRLLSAEDVHLLEAAERPVRGAGFGGTAALLEHGLAAAAVVDGRVVAIAHTSARTARYADIGVCTLAPWRNRGYATAAASLVARAVQAAGQVPVWSAGWSNAPSLRVAQKIGFRPIGKKVYVGPPWA